jgi:serine protease Do
MSRLIAFSLCGAFAGVALLDSARAATSEPASSLPLDAAGMADAIEATVGRVFHENADAVVRVESEDELGKVAGTGFFADMNGTIYTLTSVVGDGLSVMVTHAGQRWPARLLTKDSRSGIALIKIETPTATPFLTRGDSGELKAASPLIAIGFPFDHDVTPSFGLVGGFDRQSAGRFFATTHIRANIPVQRGQGGSPVLNMDGKAVGILVSSFEEGAGCYVLPMRAAEKLRSDYERFGGVRHGWAGVTVQEVPQAVNGSRIAIDVVDPSGPAVGEFRPGDVVLQVGDITVREPEDALDAAFFLTAGDSIQVKVARGDEILNISFTPGQHPMERSNDLQALGPDRLMNVVPATTP